MEMCLSIWIEESLKRRKVQLCKGNVGGTNEPREDIPCVDCVVYKNMRFKKTRDLIITFLSLLGRLRNTHL